MRSVRSTAVTWAPSARAICTANWPTAPAAPLTRTRSPGCTAASLRTVNRAISAEVGTAAASTNETPSGMRSRAASGAFTYSANVPPLRHWKPSTTSPNTGSPTWNRDVPGPSASTTPAASVPGIGLAGLRSPPPIRRMT